MPASQVQGVLKSLATGQINLLQVIWGDTRANIPPNWGKEEI